MRGAGGEALGVVVSDGFEVAIVAPEPTHPVEQGAGPSFSVIVAAYNVAPWLGEAISSALAQTRAPIEIVVCDDGSTDDIDRALAPFSDHITLLRQDNRGEAAAKNACVRAASGDFVVTLDGDDVDLPERLESLARLAARRPDLEILSTDCWLTVDGAVIRRYHHEGHPYEVHDQRRRILERNFIFNPAVRRTTWLEVGGMDERIAEPVPDWECWQRIILDGGLAGLVDEPLTMYRQRPGRRTDDRRALYLGRVGVMERSLRRADLRPHERSAVIDALRPARRRLSDESVRTGHRRARHDARAVLVDRGQPTAARVRAAVAQLSPSLARRAHRR